MTETKRDQAACRSGLAALLAGAVPAERIERNVPMSRHTSFRIGGPADFLVTVERTGELASVLKVCHRLVVPCLILGRGTNLLVRDGGFRGVVVKFDGELAKVEFSGAAGEQVDVGAGAGLAELALRCGEKGLAGLEFAIGIPGTVGGAVVMNAGAYGSEMKDVVEAGTFFGPGRPGVPVDLSAADLEFGHRSSRPQREGWVIVSARLRLQPDEPAAIRLREEDYTARRRAKQPLDLPSAGSVFRRPRGYFAGTLVEGSGCKGLRVGDAQVSELHAGFIVNLGAATAADVLELIGLVQKRVSVRYGVWLEPEICIVGEDPF